MANFKVIFTGDSNFGVTMTDSQENFSAEMGTTTTVLPEPYGGPYTVTPDETVQTLATTGKSMAEDVVVYAIEALTDDEIRSAVAAGWN